MSQSLVVDQAEIDVDFKLSSVCSTVHCLVAVVVETRVEQFFTKIVDNIVVFVSLK